MSFNHMQGFFTSTDHNESLIKNHFKLVCHELDSFVRLGVKNGGLGKDDLLDIYIKTIRTDSKSCCPGTELGTQVLFEALLGRENKTHFCCSHDEYVTAELIQAIARGISIGSIRSDVFKKGILTSIPVP